MSRFISAALHSQCATRPVAGRVRDWASFFLGGADRLLFAAGAVVLAATVLTALAPRGFLGLAFGLEVEGFFLLMMTRIAEGATGTSEERFSRDLPRVSISIGAFDRLGSLFPLATPEEGGDFETVPEEFLREKRALAFRATDATVAATLGLLVWFGLVLAPGGEGEAFLD